MGSVNTAYNAKAGRSITLEADYVTTTDTGHNVHVMAAHGINWEKSSRLKEGDIIDHMQLFDSTGPYNCKGPLVVLKTQYSNYDGRHAIFQLVAPVGMNVESPNTWQNHPNKKHVDVQYLSAAQRIMYEGAHSGNRTSTPTTKLFGHMMQFDMRDGLPLVTTKFTAFKGIMKELGWLCRGETNINTLGAKIWNEWANEDGELGPVYGAMWRGWEDTRIIDASDEKGIEFLIGQDYELKGTFDQTQRMDEELRAKMRAGEFSLVDFVGYLEQNGMRTAMYPVAESNQHDMRDGSIQMYFGDTILELWDYVETSEIYYRVLNGLGIEGKWDADSLVFTKKFDQLDSIMHSLKNNPNDRRMLVTALNPGLTAVTNLTMNPNQRKEHWLELEAARLYKDQDFMERMDVSEGTDTEIRAEIKANCLEEAERILRNDYPEDFESYDLEIEAGLTARLDMLEAPKTRYFKPHENASVGQQALPPCHMMFQLGTSPMDFSDRHEHWSNVRKAQLLQDVDFMESEGLLDYDKDDHIVQIRVASAIAQELYRERPSLVSKEGEIEHMNNFFNEKGVPTHFIDMTMYQRSADWFLGVPFNIASYSALLMAFGKQTGMVARNFFHMFGDYHIYDNHREQFEIQMQQEVKPMPTLEIKDFDSFDELTGDHFVLHNYEHGPKLDGEVAV